MSDYGRSIPEIAYAWDVFKDGFTVKTLIANIEQTLRVCCPGEICYDKKYLTYRALTH